MKIYNFTGYSLILIHVVVSGLAAPEHWGFLLGANNRTALPVVHLVSRRTVPFGRNAHGHRS